MYCSAFKHGSWQNCSSLPLEGCLKEQGKQTSAGVSWRWLFWALGLFCQQPQMFGHKNSNATSTLKDLTVFLHFHSVGPIRKQDFSASFKRGRFPCGQAAHIVSKSFLSGCVSEHKSQCCQKEQCHPPFYRVISSLGQLPGGITVRLFMPAELHQCLCWRKRGCDTRGRNDWKQKEHSDTWVCRACRAKHVIPCTCG